MEPLHSRAEMRVLNSGVALHYRLLESERRIIEILSCGEGQQLHAHVDRFPWHELEELLGEELQTALRLTMEKTKYFTETKEAYVPNIFDKYVFDHRL